MQKNINKSKKNKFNLDNLPPTCYHKAYFPNTQKINKESGYEDKFGGDVPFFIKGESWPMFDRVPQIFLGQLRDPRKNDNILYRIFIPDENDILLENYHITKIKLNEENLKKQVIITKPKYNGNKVNELIKFLPYKIIDWIIHDEMKDFDSILKILNIKLNNGEYDIYRELWYDKMIFLSNNKSNTIKVGGTPIFFSFPNKKNMKKYNFLQLRSTDYLQYEWMGGIAHISDKCELYWDP